MSKHKILKLAVLISGNGSNLQAIINAIAQQKLNAEITVVISDKPDAYGLTRAKNANIPCIVLTKHEYSDRENYDTALANMIENHHADLIILAGFMRILSSEFVRRFHGKILNIHPSLLPNYRGVNTHARVLAASEKQHGVSVHFVTEELDAGPVIAQTTLKVLTNDTVDSLKQRIHQLEHQLYPLVIEWIAQGKLKLTNHKILMDEKPLPSTGMLVVFDSTTSI